jgi:hypothetical protein
MSELKNSKYQFDSEANSDGLIQIPKELLNQLNKTGTKNISVVIEPNYMEVFNSLGLTMDTIKRISELQELPSEIVLEFYQSKSSIDDKNFLKRIQAYA